MKLIKQDVVFIPVSVNEEMPPKGMKISVSFDDGKNYSYETIGKDWKAKEVSYTHWLKPIKDVFVLIEQQILYLLIDFHKEQKMGAIKFLETITKQ